MAKNVKDIAWKQAYRNKVKQKWTIIDRRRFQEDFLYRQYVDINIHYDINGEPKNKRAITFYFSRILNGFNPATNEASNFANDFFQINRN